MSFLSNNRFDLIMAFFTVFAVAAHLGTNRANSPLQVKRMLDGRLRRAIVVEEST